MAVSQNPCAEGCAFTPNEGTAAQYLSFTSIYDACKSAKGVRLNRDSVFAVFARGSTMKKPKGPRKSRGPFCYENPVVRSAPPVEAIDEFGRDGLHEGPSAIECVVRSNRAARADDANRKVVPASIVGEAIFALPEQAGDPVDRIFGAAAEEPAVISAVRQRGRGRRERGGVNEICAVEASLGVTAIHIGQEAGKCYMAQATTASPAPLKLLLANKAGRPSATAGAVVAIVALDVGPLRVSECADHPVSKRSGELIVAADTDLAEPAAATVVVTDV